MTTDNQQDLEAMAERVAEKAVETFALRMGLDPEDKDALKEFRENLAFVSRMKRGANQMSGVILKTCAGAAVTAFLWMLVQGFRDWIYLPKIGG
jgi:hypothetical protein